MRKPRLQRPALTRNVRLSDAARRGLLVDYLKLLAWRVNGAPPMPADLPPRQRQTLLALLDGDGEKQVAARLGLSGHTVHAHVKRLYKRLGVATRGELLARFGISRE